ncbi:FAD binding domain-containing protein [Chachezhania antarctica]|uniref:FAD binding domain-containing protein n=1 Tax=Chachezhania antarctica TaxID=2340860 RepID=UPI000EAFDFE2|nr:FAD binding domain-containing protein [Chachezhania antarctica]
MAYLSPTELTDALAALRDGQAKVIAGGTDVFPAMARGKGPAAFLDVTRIAGLTSITSDDGGTRIGAAVSWSAIVAADLPPAFDALKEAAREVGSIQIQNAGTIAGNICNASPAADGVPALLALDARVEIASADRGVRVLPLADFLLGVRKTALEADELVTAVLVPPQPDGMGSAFAKLGSRRYLVISITMTAANILLDREGAIAEARIAVGACSAVARRLPDLERALIGQRPDAADVLAEHLGPLSPIDDVRGSAAYRLDVVQEQCRRAIQRAGR